LQTDLTGSPNINKDFLLKKSKNFCMLPWVHFHMWPDSKVFPCCISDSFFPVAKYEGSLKEVWNSPKMRELRRDMLIDRSTSACGRCYELEAVGVQSLRTCSNDSFGKHFDAVETTQEDGTVDKIQLRYLDVRFSNLCNFKCRTCGPDLSSAWVDDHNALHGKLPWKVLKVGSRLWEELEPLLEQVETAYFAGGEPIICDELYQILDHWIKIGHLNVALGYTTNFSILKYKDKNVLDYWKKFPNTRISASLDDSGERAEYLRKGTQWSLIEANRKQMLKECPEIYFEITPTIGLYNVWHFPVFHMDWVSRGLVEIDNIRLNLVTKPVNLSVSILPKAMRNKLVGVWEKALAELTTLAASKGKDIPNVQQGYTAVINMLKNDECTESLDSFWKYSDSLDELRNEKIFSTFPELKPLRKKSFFGFL
jgi:hypothetical protein